MKVLRAEHPRPDLKRKDWLNLNGEWDFEIDNELLGKTQGYTKRRSFKDKINLPFCPESKLSGVENTDFMNAVWYGKNIQIPKDWGNKRVLLHVGACDYFSTVYINGQKVGDHTGGYTPFCFDITDYLTGDDYLIIYAEDDVRSNKQASGKQSHLLESYGCFYTRTTGIWQTVWLEAVSPFYVKRYEVFPNVEKSSVKIKIYCSKDSDNANINVKAIFDGKIVGEFNGTVKNGLAQAEIQLSEKHLWGIDKGSLYDLKFNLTKDNYNDAVDGYFGLREIALRKDGFYLNGERLYLRMVLDQGFYPDGVITAPTDQDFITDIEIAKMHGFHGARLHQKVFEPRYLYHADRLGFIVWGEAGNWGMPVTDESNYVNYQKEWIEEVERDFSHPSIIGWCPYNETWERDASRKGVKQIDDLYNTIKKMDTTRPVIADSGSLPTNFTDINDVHTYAQTPEELNNVFEDIEQNVVKESLRSKHKDAHYLHANLPVFFSEFGGIKLATDDADKKSWGYGAVNSQEEFYERLENQVKFIKTIDRIVGFCYTQLTDVEQEQNGLVFYDRRLKFDPERIKEIIKI